MQPEVHFIASRRAVVCAALLDEYRARTARVVSLPARPRGPFDRRSMRDCEADGAQQEPIWGAA